jgi:hypothetical protein
VTVTLFDESGARGLELHVDDDMLPSEAELLDAFRGEGEHGEALGPQQPS